MGRRENPRSGGKLRKSSHFAWPSRLRNAQGLLIQDDQASVQLVVGVLAGLADIGGALPRGFRVRIELRQLSTDCATLILFRALFVRRFR